MIDILLIIFEQTLMHIPLMFGAYISFSLMKVPDLSIETAYVVGALCGSHMLMGTQGVPMGLQLILVIVASLIGGILVGITSSLITQKAKIPHLLSSIITFGLFHGINQFFRGNFSFIKTQLKKTRPKRQIAHPARLPLPRIGGMTIGKRS